jgi:alkyldihydroxyacetonephosphate synthase
LNKIIKIDTYNMQATVQSGVPLQTLEDELMVYHHPLQTIIVEETLKLGGSMCHHHGIGKFRNEWTKDEHGSAYYMLEKLKQAFDPNGTMNFGTIFPQEERIKYQK